MEKTLPSLINFLPGTYTFELHFRWNLLPNLTRNLAKFNLTLILILIFNKFCIQKISPKVRWLSTVDEAAHIYHTDTFFIACILIRQSPLSSVIIFTNVPDVAAPGHHWPGWQGDATPSRAPEAAPRPRSAASCRTTFNEQQRSVARRTIRF